MQGSQSHSFCREGQHRFKLHDSTTGTDFLCGVINTGTKLESLRYSPVAGISNKLYWQLLKSVSNK